MILQATNEFQTPITEELRDSLVKEVWDEFMDIISNIEFIKRLISPERKRAKDLPRDSYGRIIVDICNPHILENMDYFRPAAIHYQHYGCYTKLMPNPNPKSEYGLWLAREVRRCLEGMVRPEDGEWIPGDMYFYLNYFPIIQTKLRKGSKVGDRVVDFPEVWEGVYWRFHYLYQARNGGLYDNFTGAKHAVEIASRGRAIEINEFVETPEGRKLWKDIKIGDSLFGNNNTTTKVLDIPFAGESPCYKITLRDGRTIIASDNHIWNVYKRNSKKPILKTTLDLLNEYKHPHKKSARNPKGVEYIYSIPSNNGVEFKEVSTQVDPYTFGLLLGDGCFKHLSCYYTCETIDFDIIRQFIPYQYTKWKDKYAYRIHIPDWIDKLKFYDLADKGSESKFIPKEFKYNSRRVRLSLLQGLMDTDGHVSTDGIPIFSTVSKILCQDIVWLARSLGYNCSFKKHSAGYKKNGIYKKCKDVYVVRIYGGSEIFRLSRKSNLVNYKSNYAKSRRDSTRIINIEFVGTRQCKCVTVDALDDTFLIGDFIQTHNSKSYSIASIMCKLFLLGESFTSLDKVKCTVTAYQKEYLIKDGILNKFIDGIDFCSKYTQFPRARLKSSLSDMQWVAGYLDKETNIPRGSQNEVLGVAVKDDTDKLRGKRSQRLFYEEFGAFPKFLDVWQTSLPNVQEGNVAFGMAYAIGTGGSEGSDFMGALEMINYPDGYNVYSLPNVYDKGNVGAKRTIFFFPSYINSKGFYNQDGVSDVVGALIDEIKFRVKLKYNSSDPIQLTRRKAEYAFTIVDAIMRRDSNIFPSDKLNDRILELDSNPSSLDDMWVGRLVQTKEGNIVFAPDADVKPILDFPHKDNKIEGAIHINKMPIKGSDGKIPWGRYIAGCLLPGEKVLTTKGLKPVEDITYADILINIEGCPVRINQLLQYDKVDEEVYTIKVANTFRTTTFTKEHPIYASNRITKYSTKANKQRQYRFNFDFIKAADLKVGQWVRVPNLYTKESFDYKALLPFTFVDTLDFWWFIGLWLGDGWVTNGKISISFNKSENYYIDRFRKICKSLFKRAPYTRIRNNCVEVSICYKELAEKIREVFGVYASGKAIPEMIKYIPKNYKYELILGYLDSDGCITKDSTGEFVSINLELLESIQDILFSLGYKSSLQKLRDKGVHIVTRQESLTRDTYSLRMPYWDIYKFSQHFGNIKDHKLSRLRKTNKRPAPSFYECEVDENYIYFKITQIIKSLYTGVVYNFDCETHTFMCYHIPTHNCDPYDDDVSDTMSLGAIYVLDLFTDELVCEYVGRPMFAEDFYETCRRILLMYNAKCLYENNKKGLFTYFSQHNCLYLLADVPEYLKDKDLVKGNLYGNKVKGVNASQPIQTYGRGRIRDWLLKPIKVLSKVSIEGHEEETEITINNINRCYYRALMKELAMWNPDGNFDRYDALLMLMLLREQELMLCGVKSPSEVIGMDQPDYLGNDEFFTRNYDYRFSKTIIKNI